MSEVKRYGSVVFDSGLIEMSCGDYVTYSDYQKLVAENAALKKFIVDECVIPHEFYGDNKDAADFMPATPNTDAAIAEIKAQGLMELAKYCNGYAENHVYTFTKGHAEEFAANLRAGVKG